MQEQRRLFIIDGMNMAFRNYFALGQAKLTSPDGFPVACILGTALFMNKLLREQKPDYIAIAMDTPEPTFRHKFDPEYKANRGQMEDELVQQLPFFIELLTCLGCTIIKKDGFEADDIIGTICEKIKRKNITTYIVSGDKDYCQLVNDKIFLYQPKKNTDPQVITAKEVVADYGCTPQQITDCLALIGDPVDNIKGVAGIGKKTAGKLLQEFGSIENIYKNLDSMKDSAQKRNLQVAKDAIKDSQYLVKIDKKVPIKVNIDTFKIDYYNALTSEKLIDFYKKFDFKTLLDRSKDLSQKATTVEGDKRKEFKQVKTKKDLDLFLQEIKNKDLFFLVQDNFLLLCGVDNQPIKIILDTCGVSLCRQLKTLFSSKQKKISSDIKSTIKVLNKINISIAEPFFDISGMDYLLNAGEQNHSLEDLRSRYLDNKDYLDVVAIRKIYYYLFDKIKKENLLEIFLQIDMPSLKVISSMEDHGLYLDVAYLEKLTKEIDKKIFLLEKKIHTQAGQEFNINSSKQLQEIIFVKLQLHNKLKIKNIKKIKSGYSTDESVLKKLSKAEIAQNILVYRELTKLKNTYIDKLPLFVDPKSKRVHTHLSQITTATGRLSSERPNLQNIPARTYLGLQVRRAFRAQKKDSVLVSADYSQIELRVLCHYLSSQSQLVQAINKDIDIHTLTASKIFSLPKEKISTKMREQAKTINFGVIYGMGANKLSNQLAISLQEARDFIDAYFSSYPEVKILTQSLKDKAAKLGYTETIFSRRRYINASTNEKRRYNFIDNIAINSPIQGSAADVIKIAMINTYKCLSSSKFKTKMILQIHDELLFETPKSELESVCKVIKESMENIPGLRAPLKVEFKIGQSWADMKKIKVS
jgi:DNA polymerase I